MMVHETLNFNGGLLVSAVIYLYLCIQLQLFDKDEVTYYFAQSSMYLLDEENSFNNIYRRFVQICFGIEMEELIPYV